MRPVETVMVRTDARGNADGKFVHYATQPSTGWKQTTLCGKPTNSLSYLVKVDRRADCSRCRRYAKGRIPIPTVAEITNALTQAQERTG